MFRSSCTPALPYLSAYPFPLPVSPSVCVCRAQHYYFGHTRAQTGNGSSFSLKSGSWYQNRACGGRFRERS
uniref:Uncharacterized protein n=1 Tax=Anguilla anguilla TaxID=7936 RepID=A0A0E9PBI8_ANGAN